MMLRLKNLDKEVYNEYVRAHQKESHFLHTECFGELVKVTKHLTPYYLGLVNEKNEILGTTLVLQEQLKMNYCCLYIPAGFIIDYKDEELVRAMTKGILSFSKNKKAISIRMTPYLGENTSRKDLEIAIRNLKKIGFKYLERPNESPLEMLPKVTSKINLTKEMNEIENSFKESTKEKIKTSLKFEIETFSNTKGDLQELIDTINSNEDKDCFNTLYEICNGEKDTKATIILSKINLNKTLKSLEKGLKRINDQISILPIDSLTKSSKAKLLDLTTQKEKIIQELEKFREYKQKYNQQLTLSIHLILECNKKAWLLYDYNSDLLEETYAKYNAYYEDIKYCKNNNDIFIEQKEPSFIRKDYAAETIKNIGEWKYITNPIMYFILKKIFR